MSEYVEVEGFVWCTEVFAPHLSNVKCVPGRPHEPIYRLAFSEEPLDASDWIPIEGQSGESFMVALAAPPDQPKEAGE